VELDLNGNPLPKKTLWMPRSITELEDAVVKGNLLVLKNPCLTYNSASAVLARDPAGNAKWEKRKSSGRIDGIVTLSMGVGFATALPMRQPEYSITFLGV
jgi:phage terminase large subunit-like protein